MNVEVEYGTPKIEAFGHFVWQSRSENFSATSKKLPLFFVWTEMGQARHASELNDNLRAAFLEWRSPLRGEPMILGPDFSNGPLRRSKDGGVRSPGGFSP